jgi:hypothetical protein
MFAEGVKCLVNAVVVSSICIFGTAAPALAVGPSQTELDQSAKATGSWLMTNKSYDGHRYVDLNQMRRLEVGCPPMQ